MKDDQLVFFKGMDINGDHVLIIGLSDASIQKIKEGKEHAIDLSKAGMNLKISMISGKTNADIIKTLDTLCKDAGVAYEDQRNKDFGINLENYYNTDGKTKN